MFARISAGPVHAHMHKFISADHDHEGQKVRRADEHTAIVE
jgi:hypothetical protein